MFSGGSGGELLTFKRPKEEATRTLLPVTKPTPRPEEKAAQRSQPKEVKQETKKNKRPPPAIWTIYLPPVTLIPGFDAFLVALIAACARRGIKLEPVKTPEGAAIVCYPAMSTTGRMEWSGQINEVLNAKARGLYMDAVIFVSKNNNKENRMPAIPRGGVELFGPPVSVDELWEKAQNGDPPMRVYTQHYRFERGIYPPTEWKFNMDQINAFADDIVALNK
jgi:hypothetical protein